MPVDAARGLAGRLDATFAPGARGAVVRATSSPPLELRGPFPGTPLPRFFLRNVTCGILDGDDYEVTLRAEEGACVRIEPTSATKVYAARSGGARSRVRLEALPGSALHYSAAATILHQGACLTQETEIVLHEGASVAYLEVLALGRLARGERLAFRRYASSLAVRRPDGDPLYEERFILEPWTGIETADAATGGAGVIGSLLLLGTTVGEAPTVEASTDVYAGASPLPNGAGVLVRVLGNRAEAVTACLEAVASHQHALHP